MPSRPLHSADFPRGRDCGPRANPAGKCHDVNFSLGAYGVSMSRTSTVCPEKISINVNNSKRFFAQWNGAVRADNPGVVAQDFTSVPNGAGSGFEYWVYEYHTVYS